MPQQEAAETVPLGDEEKQRWPVSVLTSEMAGVTFQETDRYALTLPHADRAHSPEMTSATKLACHMDTQLTVSKAFMSMESHEVRTFQKCLHLLSEGNAEGI